MARVRPKSVIKNSHIGNFVEVKKSTLIGIKAGHLSYLGDSFIDEGSNVGAGTITCNYDGKAKYQTKIGKNVFIGSDTQLIAPVVIEDDVMIAAGSTINKDIKKGSLAISRSPLKSIKNFYYKFFNKER
jgi:bifunctional UDP-N-acetylglucosamine pyrophosphorylase/glucosamine-1-phosphate N-acetyltransferase